MTTAPRVTTFPRAQPLQVPVVKFTARADVNRLEEKLKMSIYQKTPANSVRADGPGPSP